MVNDKRTRLNRIYLENIWSARANHLGAMGTSYRAGLGISGIGEGARFLANHGAEKPEHSGKSDNVSGDSAAPTGGGMIAKIKGGLRHIFMGPKSAYSDEEKREAQERLMKLEKELAIIIANMQHTNERFDNR
jgi:hypothetical protein